MEPAQGTQRIGGAAAEHLRYIDTTSHCQVGTRACGGETEAQHLPGAHGKRGVRALLAAIEQRRHLCTAHRHQRILLKLQLRPHQCALQACGASRVAHQVVGRTQGVLIERARGRDAQVVVAFAAQVLHRGGQAGFEYLDHASTSCNVRG
ncbi:hypothetical protein D3C76_1255460 [compost metagenome]